jgi:hypothetical protein
VGAVGGIIATLVILNDGGGIMLVMEMVLNDLCGQLMCLGCGESRTFFWNRRRKRIKNK